MKSTSSSSPIKEQIRIWPIAKMLTSLLMKVGSESIAWCEAQKSLMRHLQPSLDFDST